MKKFIFIALLIFISNSIFSRGFYEIKFQCTVEGVTTYYTGLLLFFSDNSNLNRMRVIYNTSNGEQVLAEESIKVIFRKGFFLFRKGVGNKFRILQGYDAKILNLNLLTNKNEEYSPDAFIFKKTKNGYFEPYRAESYIDAYSKVKGKITSYRLLEKVDNSYLRLFDWGVNTSDTSVINKRINNNDPKSLQSFRATTNGFAKSFFSLSKDNVPNIKTLHIILVSNTKVNDIGRFCSENERKLEDFFSSIAEVEGCKSDIIKINENDFTLAKLNDVVSNLKIDSTLDGIIFYYSGHGFRYPNQVDSFPIMELRIRNLVGAPTESNSKKLIDLYDSLKIKQPKFLLTIAECCNKNITDNKFVFNTNEHDMLAAGSISLNPILVHRLLGFSGETIIGTAHPQQNSYYTRDGGIFCSSFIDYLTFILCKNDSQDSIDWLNIFEESSKLTNEEVQKRNREYTQNAVWFGF